MSRAAAMTLWFAASGCVPNATEAILTLVDGDLSVPGDVDGIRIEAHPDGDPANLLSSAEVTLCAGGQTAGCHAFPFTVLLVPGDHPDDAARIDVFARKSGGDLIHDAFVLRFVPQQTVRLQLELFRICANSDCAAGEEVCGSDGKCHPIAAGSPSDASTFIDGPIAGPMDGAPPDLTRGPRRVFLAGPTGGGLGGLAGADAFCQKAASGHAWLDGGAYKAVLTDSTNEPLTRIVLDGGDREIHRADGKLVATDATFWSPHHLSPINQFADGHAAGTGADDYVWTAFQSTGLREGAGASDYCDDWQSSGGNFGSFQGSANEDFGFGDRWANSGISSACNASVSIYCIEQ